MTQSQARSLRGVSSPWAATELRGEVGRAIGPRRRVGLRQQRYETLLTGEDLGERVAQIGARVDPHLLTGRQDRERVGGAPRARLVPNEEPRLAVEHPGAQTALDLVVGQLHTRVAQERREAWPLAMQIAQGATKGGLRLDIPPPQVEPGAQLSHQRRAVATSSLEALLEALAKALGLGIDVEDPPVDLEPLEDTRIARAKRLDEAAPPVCITSTAVTAGFLFDAVVRGRPVAHHAAERAPSEEPLQVLGVRARCVQEARVARGRPR